MSAPREEVLEKIEKAPFRAWNKRDRRGALRSRRDRRPQWSADRRLSRSLCISQVHGRVFEA
ncbi:hypothetical protein P3X46_033891, partial [Hevea brasiliensis]